MYDLTHLLLLNILSLVSGDAYYRKNSCLMDTYRERPRNLHQTH